MPRITIKEIELFRVDLKTRMPFRYGIAVMTELPHLFLRLTAEVEGRVCRGIAADHLPPRWFKKDPDQDPADEIEEMLSVIHHAINQAEHTRWDTPFAWWSSAYRDQMEWADMQGIPHLLAHFGITLVERALLEATIKAQPGHTFYEALCENTLGLTLEAFNEIPPNFHPGSFFRNSTPLRSLILRHTVGLSDPIFESDVDPSERPEDLLPVSLEAVLREYGVYHFKIKLSADLDHDRERLVALNRCFDQAGLATPAFSVDGNELYGSLEEFQEHWDSLMAHCGLLGKGELLWIEQPVNRATALNGAPGDLKALQALPPVIIDESDADLDSLPQALELGYSGISHKNCKGIFKSLINRCRLHQQGTSRFGHPLIMSAEDLSTIGPVSLLQDLLIQAVLGNASVERNGHHFFSGLSAFPAEVNREVVRNHPDLFRFKAPENPIAQVDIRQGNLSIDSLHNTPLGPGFELEPLFAQRIR